MFLPENIDLGHSEKYVLSIRLKSTGFMFSISDPENGLLYCLRDTTFLPGDNLLKNVQRIVFDLNFLTQEFKRTNVVVVSSDYDLIPAAYLNAKEKECLYDITHAGKSEHILHGLIDKQDITTLFNIDKEIYEFLMRNLWNPHFFHHSNLLVNMFDNKGQAAKSKNRMYLYFHNEFMDVLCFFGNKLIHCLTYENEPEMNQLYFVLKLWENCAFDQQEDYLYIAGEGNDRMNIKLQDYVKNVEEINTPSEIYLWSEDARKAPLDLLSLAL